MNLAKAIFLVASSLTAGCAFVAAYFWYRSSLPTPPAPDDIIASADDAPQQHILGAQVDIINLRAAMIEASGLNKKAAIWSAWAAIFGAIAAFVSMMM